MSRSAWLALSLVIVVFAWGLYDLLEARVGDVYPPGSSFRSDALGTRAIHDAIAESLPRDVVRLRGRQSEWRSLGRATVIVQGLSFETLMIQQDPLVLELTGAARKGARVVVTLRDSEVHACRKTYCQEDRKTRCIRGAALDSRSEAKPTSTRKNGSVPPAGSAPPMQTNSQSEPERSKDESCETAALGLWGFEVGGSQQPATDATLAKNGEARLPRELPWHMPAHFIELNSSFTPIYTRRNDVVVAERSFGEGSIVLMAEGYLLNNQAQREARAPGFLLWLLGNNRRVAFEESHLGVVEHRGIMSLLRELHLQGFVIGCCVIAFLFAWQRWRPLANVAGRRSPISAAAADSTLLPLLMRCMSPRQALAACIDEARLAQLEKAVERAKGAKLSASAAEFNRIFCEPEERSDYE